MNRRHALLLLSAAPLAACVSAPPPATQDEILGLGASLAAMSPNIDPEEAHRAARVAYARTAELRDAYQITDPPLIHNAKVNAGIKPRGLCWQWANDMESRLRAEKFKTFSFHRAIANATTLRIDHSTVIMSARDAGMFDGMVLDPWRKGGILTWVPTATDPDYKWVSRAQVFADREAKERLKNY
ncbi:MAG: hypothetical protein AAF393_02745 [Pseudomonadota bacterium]